LFGSFGLPFASAFGQTWFISLFAGEIKLAYGLSDGQWGAIYTVATLASATLLLWRGSLADTAKAVRASRAPRSARSLAFTTVFSRVLRRSEARAGIGIS